MDKNISTTSPRQLEESGVWAMPSTSQRLLLLLLLLLVINDVIQRHCGECLPVSRRERMFLCWFLSVSLSRWRCSGRSVRRWVIT